MTIAGVAARVDGAAERRDDDVGAALDALPREGFDSMTAADRARALPFKTWIIVAAGLAAWGLIAIPGWLVFG